METSILKLITKKPTLQDFIEHKPCCTDVEFTMPPAYSFEDKLETIMLHSHEIVAFARSHNNCFIIDFLNFNKLTWEKKLFISTNITAKNFVAFLGELNIIYFIILDPATMIIKFDEISWTYEIFNIFNDSSKGSFINERYIYILRNGSAYSIDLHSLFDENTFLTIQKIDQNSSHIEDDEINIVKKDELGFENSDASNNENKKSYQIQKYIFEEDYFDQKKIFATQQFSHYNLIYRNDDDLPLLIFDTFTNNFCFEKELREKNDYFKRKISSIYPLNEAKFMPIPGKDNGFFLFHDFESYQNAIIPLREPLLIQECQNESGEPLAIITVSVRRISPIIGMFTFPGESFNFFSVSSTHYYQFYKSCGLLLYINHSKNIINLKQKNNENQGLQNLNTNPLKKEITSNGDFNEAEENSEKADVPSSALTNTNNFKNTFSLIDKTKVENLGVQNHQQSEEKPLIKDSNELKNPIKMIMHFISLGPLDEVSLPYVEVNLKPEYRMIITTPRIPHCLFIKSVEVIVTCVDNNDVLSFFLKPSLCINPQKVEVNCNPETKYKIKIKVSNGFQNTFSDAIEFITPNPGVPPKVEEFFGTYISDDVYIFKWKAVSELFRVNYYILEGCKEISTEPKQDEQCSNKDNSIELDDLSAHIHDNSNEYLIDELANQRMTNNAFEENFEYIVELSNDVQNNNICGAKLRITTPYKQFRVRASNTMGISEPSDPCKINRKTSIPSQTNYKKSSSRISKDQVQYLSEYYSNNPYPDFNERNKIAELLSLSYQTVNSWFARKRHIDKTNSKKTPDTNVQEENNTNFNSFALF